MNTTQQWYVRNWRAYATKEYSVPFEVMNGYYQQLPNLAGKTVLDLGCGAGRDVDYFVSQGTQLVICVDTCKRFLTRIKKRHGNKVLTLEKSAQEYVPYPVDIVWSMCCLQHLRPKGALETIRRAMANAGEKLLITLLEGTEGKVVKDGKDYYTYTTDHLRHLLPNCQVESVPNSKLPRNWITITYTPDC